MSSIPRIAVFVSICLWVWGKGAAIPALAEERPAVSCLGRLVPGADIILVEVPFFTQEPPIIAELLVKEGDKVAKGQVIARTHHHRIATTMLLQAQAEVQVSRLALALTLAAAEPTLVAAQKAQFESMTASATLEENLYKRRLSLEKQNAVTGEELDTAKLKAEISQKNMEHARLSLEALRTPQKEKIDLDNARLNASLAAEAKAEQMLQLTEIKAPLEGTILQIHARPGEKAEKNGLLEMGDTAHMRVQAEVYVSDIRHVRAGQKAEIRGEAFAGSLSAQVESIDPLVRPNRFVDVSPKSVRENRVVNVWLSLDNPAAVETLSGAEVSVVITP